MKHLYWQAEDWSYANWMYKHDALYRSLIEEERAKKAQREQEEARLEAELDARNPLMTRFTKKVISALEARIAELRKSMNTATSNRAYGEAYCAMHDVYDIKRTYEARLAYYQGTKEALPRTVA